jgi:hypothetical protein
MGRQMEGADVLARVIFLSENMDLCSWLDTCFFGESSSSDMNFCTLYTVSPF